MKRSMALFGAGLLLAGLSACSEKPQSMGGVKGDVPAYQGAQNAFVAPGWKPGDKTSWEQALKVRAQTSQNDYAKAK